MTSEDNRDKEFTERLSRDPVLVALAATATGGPHGEADGHLFARRYLERELGAGPGGLGEHVYREAAGTLRASGHPAEADTLRMIAGTSSLLAAAAADWAGRYAARPVTATERAGLRLIEANALRLAELPGTAHDGGLGADGARYTPAVLTGPGGAPDPAVIVTTHAGTAEVVTGFSEDDGLGRDAWLADRLGPPRESSPSPRPLRSSADGPACRTAREELALAFLLTRDRPVSGEARSLSERSFTACTRAEIYLAWRDLRDHGTVRPAVDSVRSALALRMLRAPGWAAPFTGWPFGHLALAYFDRITATPVTAFQGSVACRDLVREDAEALRTARAGGPGRRPGRPAWHPSYGPRPEPLPLPRPEDPSLGSGPRL